MANGNMDGADAARIMYGGYGMSELTINQALHLIQTNLVVPKTRRNNHLKCDFRNAEDIVKAVVAILPPQVTLSLTDDIIMLGTRYYIKATAVLSDGNSKIEAHGFAREAETKPGNDVAQVTGAASSYARKYALNGLFAIDDGIDNDTISANGDYHAPKVTKAPNPPKVLTPEQKLDAATIQAHKIIAEYKLCQGLTSLSDVQEKYKTTLTAFKDRYPDLDKEINTVVLQVIASFDKPDYEAVR